MKVINILIYCALTFFLSIFLYHHKAKPTVLINKQLNSNFIDKKI